MMSEYKTQKEHAIEMNQLNPRVSVIIPVFNVEAYLRECLDSIIGQSLKEIEIICVNDGSLDASLDILEEYRNRDSRVTVISRPNGGQSAARNDGMRYAHGDYLYFIDSDDYLDTSALESLVALAKENDLDAVLFGIQPFYASEEVHRTHSFDSYYNKESVFGIHSGVEYLKETKERGTFLTSACHILWRHSLLTDNQIWFKEGIIHEDNLFTFQALIMAKRVLEISDNYYYRRVRPNSTMTQAISYKNVLGYFYCALGVLEFAMRGRYDEEKEHEIWRAYEELTDQAAGVYGILDIDEREKVRFSREVERELFNQIILQRDELNRTRDELTRTKYDLDSVHASVSFRIGRAVTWLPRKARGGVLCYAEHAKSMGTKLKNGFDYCLQVYNVRHHLIVLQMRSRLGNQMFIYALYLRLISIGRAVKIDTATKLEQGERDYNPALLSDVFDLPLNHAENFEISALLNIGNHKSDRLRRSVLQSHSLLLEEADDYAYDDRFLNTKSGYFTGWFQNSRYFEGIENTIRFHFRFKNIPEDNSAACHMEQKIIHDPFAVSVHFRFGDYLSRGNVLRYGGFCTDEYYLEALKTVFSGVGKTKLSLYVFSDDLSRSRQWYEQHEDFMNQCCSNVFFVDVCTEKDSWIDMYLMSLCHHNIIANSTFSWWAAYLNQNPDRIAVSPAWWFRKNNKDYHGPLLYNSILLDSTGSQG